jgi:membrane fusion protein, multidrug efflux system
MSETRPFSRVHLMGTLALLAGLGTIALLWSNQRARLRSEGTLRRSEREAGLRVRTALASAEGGARALQFQGEALPYVSTTLFAKVAGFLREVRVDKGSPVAAGQVLAVLESPEVDRDTQALREDAENKARNAERARQLGRQGILSPRDIEDAETAFRIAREKLASQATLQGYQTVRAPFRGVVVQRFVDPGAMVQNGGSTSTAQPLLTVAQVSRLRVTFYLDQGAAPLVAVGQSLEVRSAERPDVVRTLRVSRLAGALDPRTRTRLAEADLDNGDGTFLGGGSVQITLKLQEAPGQVGIPPEAVLLRAGRPFAAVVGPDQRVTLRALVLGEEALGRVRVVRGLASGERVVLNPGAGLQEGDRVQVM